MPPKAHAFPRSHRIGGFNAFRPVYAARMKEVRGPLAMYGRPNERGHSRLGISIGRRVGTAVKRNRIKRLLRESFRLMQHELPRGYDFVVVVSPHETLSMPEYQKLMATMAERIQRRWEARSCDGS
jgi:ribonuclease P protein component